MPGFKGVIFDLDDTLVDTAVLRALRDAGEWKAAVARLRETVVFTGVEEVVKELAARGVAVGVVTTSVSFYATKVLAHHRLPSGVLVAYHDAKPPKPHPAPIHVALSKLSLSPEDVVGVGDGEKDLRAYRAAGVRPLGAGMVARAARRGLGSCAPHAGRPPEPLSTDLPLARCKKLEESPARSIDT